jgi:hypothetical protein
LHAITNEARSTTYSVSAYNYFLFIHVIEQASRTSRHRHLMAAELVPAVAVWYLVSEHGMGTSYRKSYLGHAAYHAF